MPKGMYKTIETVILVEIVQVIGPNSYSASPRSYFADLIIWILRNTRIVFDIFSSMHDLAKLEQIVVVFERQR